MQINSWKAFSTMRIVVLFAVSTICYQATSGANRASLHYFQDTAKIKKVEPHKTIKPKSSSSSHKVKPVAPQKRNTNNQGKKDSIHSKKHVGIDHPAPDQKKLDSIVKAKNKEKAQGR